MDLVGGVSNFTCDGFEQVCRPYCGLAMSRPRRGHDLEGTRYFCPNMGTYWALLGPVIALLHFIYVL